MKKISSKILSEDQLAIQDLVVRYAEAMDQVHKENWMNTWSENGAWEGGLGKFEGTSGLEKLWEVLKPRIQGKRHVMTNHIVESGGDANSAIHRCYMLILDRSTSQIVGFASYTDRLAKIEGLWKFAHRQMLLN